jgi:sporulation protein YlmC with PRC-barrel domain
MTPTESAVAEWRGRSAVDSDGEEIGTIEEIYMDSETGRSWSRSAPCPRSGCGWTSRP